MKPRAAKRSAISNPKQPVSLQAEAHKRTRDAHGMELAEDYVEVVLQLIEEQGEARAIDIARRLGVTHVTVTKTVQRLMRDGYLHTEPYRSIFLTEKGRSLATRCKDRHLLVLKFLLAIGVPEPIAQRDAEGIEHHVSGETLLRFEKLLKTLNR